jgi:hypothetical protein
MVIKSGGYLWLLSTWKFVHVWSLHGFDLVKKHRQIIYVHVGTNLVMLV